MSKTATLALILISFLAAPATAQDPGAVEFANSCAQCHGTDGKGDGPVSAHLMTPPPDLTVLSQTNEGVFPIAEVYAIIDGRADVAVHGGRDMPIWGDRYMTELAEDEEAHPSWVEARIYALTRTLMLVEYIASIQE